MEKEKDSDWRVRCFDAISPLFCANVLDSFDALVISSALRVSDRQTLGPILETIARKKELEWKYSLTQRDLEEIVHLALRGDFGCIVSMP